MESNEDVEDDYTLIISNVKKTTSDLLFFNLKLGKIVKKITNARVFVSYKKIDDKYGVLTYLTNKSRFATDKEDTNI